MTLSRTALISFLLWVITLATFAWFFVRGNTTTGNDDRTAIVLQADERDFVLKEMRGLLLATQQILEATSQGDMKRVAVAASTAGMAGAADVNPALLTKLPLGFKTLGMSVHHDMDEMAKAAAVGMTAAEIQKMLSVTLSKCIACHSAWQLQSGIK